MPVPLSRLDLLTRQWWRLWGRPIDLDGDHSWLRAPLSQQSHIDDDVWMADWAEHLNGRVDTARPHAGLIPSMDGLARPGYDPSRLLPQVRDFYEHASDWRMEVWTEWSPLFWPGGELISRLFGKRVQQLALPMRALDVARGMSSTVSVISDETGEQRTAGWVRRLRSNGDKVFSGAYALRTLPGADGASVHVTFPLEQGNVQVFLRPRIDDDGSLWLLSPPGKFGDDGAYVMVRVAGRDHAARVPLHESFHLYVDEFGVLRTDHLLKLWGATVVRLHYKLERDDETPVE